MNVLERKVELSSRDAPIEKEKPLRSSDVQTKFHAVGICGSDAQHNAHGALPSFDVKAPVNGLNMGE